MPADPVRVVTLEALTERSAPDEESDPPPAYVTADPPPTVDDFEAVGRALRAAPVSFYPTPGPDAQVDTLALNTPVSIAGTVEGDDGEMWYRTADGEYLPEASVRLARRPPRTFPGRWIDVDLREPAMLVAYQGATPVLTTLTIHGASLHYNSWSSNWGYAASHGCLGLTHADSAFLWSWAGLGTLVSIHY